MKGYVIIVATDGVTYGHQQPKKFKTSYKINISNKILAACR
jgi:hypothetical protein